MAVATPAFTGFRPEAVQFLVDLAQNNDRAWFQPRKGDYERLLKHPLEALVAALAERLSARGVPLLADPSTSPYRIYRDVRFSKDKSPYKAHLGASFPWIEGHDATAPVRHSAGDGAHGVGGYFHIAPGEIFAGGGMWHPDPTRLATFRAAIVTDGARVHEALDDPAFVATFGQVNGDSLKRVPAGFAADHPDAALLRLKDVVFGRRLGDDEAFSPDLPDLLAETYAAATPVFRLLAGLG